MEKKNIWVEGTTHGFTKEKDVVTLVMNYKQIFGHFSGHFS